MSDNNQTTVVIIGAGVAGLAAAKELAINNIPFILVEAQDYLGGRVRNINAGNSDQLLVSIITSVLFIKLEPDLPIDLVSLIHRLSRYFCGMVKPCFLFFSSQGAQYVLGDKGNVVYDICKELNCILEPDEKGKLFEFKERIGVSKC